jgi:hypothetical protein
LSLAKYLPDVAGKLFKLEGDQGNGNAEIVASGPEISFNIERVQPFICHIYEIAKVPSTGIRGLNLPRKINVQFIPATALEPLLKELLEELEVFCGTLYTPGQSLESSRSEMADITHLIDTKPIEIDALLFVLSDSCQNCLAYPGA